MGNLLAKNESCIAPFFTIAVPHYRHKEHLKIAIDSILGQKFSDYEIVVSDNFSPCGAQNSIPNYLKLFIFKILQIIKIKRCIAEIPE